MVIIRLIGILIIIHLWGCNSNEEFLLGNWYSFDSEDKYTEVKFNKDSILIYNDRLSDIVSARISLENDTMYFFFNNGTLNKDYTPQFLLLNKDSFSLIDSNDTQVYHRIPRDEFTLDKIKSYEWYKYYILSYYLRQFMYSDSKSNLPDICPE